MWDESLFITAEKPSIPTGRHAGQSPGRADGPVELD
jgi:hypothetical protein